jgi:hypothetical protein
VIGIMKLSTYFVIYLFGENILIFQMLRQM